MTSVFESLVSWSNYIVNKKNFLPLLCWVASISAQENTIVTPENESMELSSTNASSSEIKRSDKTTEQQPSGIETPDTFTSTEELIEDLSYDFPIDI